MESNDFEPVLFCSVISSLLLVRSIYALIGVCVWGFRAAVILFVIKVPCKKSKSNEKRYRGRGGSPEIGKARPIRENEKGRKVYNNVAWCWNLQRTKKKKKTCFRWPRMQYQLAVQRRVNATRQRCMRDTVQRNYIQFKMYSSDNIETYKIQRNRIINWSSILHIGTETRPKDAKVT